MAADQRLAVGSGEPSDEIGAGERVQALAHICVASGLALLVDKYIDLRRAGARRHRELGVLGRVGRGLEDSPLCGERLDHLVGLGDVGLRVVGQHDHRVRGEELVHAAARLDQLTQAAVGMGDRRRRLVRPPAVRVVVVVGEAEEEEVVGVVFHELLRDAGRVLVARAGPREGRLARHRARAEELSVEELVRAVDGVAEAGGDGAALEEPFERELVALAAAVDQERRAGGANAGVAEGLEERLHLVAEVGHVHVVDDVVGGAEQAERAGRLERRAVLDVAPLDPVVPVHPGDPVPLGGRSGRDLRGADRRHRREGGDAVLDQLPALDQGAEVGRVARGDRLAELVGAERVDEDEAELLALGDAGHRSVRRPACFSPARLRRAKAR